MDSNVVVSDMNSRWAAAFVMVTFLAFPLVLTRLLLVIRVSPSWIAEVPTLRVLSGVPTAVLYPIRSTRFRTLTCCV